MDVNGRIALTPKKEQLKNMLILFGAMALFFISIMALDLEVGRFISRLERLPTILRLFMALEFSIVGEGMIQLLTSIAIAIGALFLGGVLALILAFLVAENTAPSKIVATIIRVFVSTVRAIPNLVLILLIVASLGLGYIAAVTSLTLSTMGYLTRAFASTIEEQPSSLIETMRSTGANWFQVVVHGFFPNVFPSFLAWISIRLELSISDSITLGVIGAGGIGTMLSRAIRRHHHAEVSTLLLIIFVAVLVIEILLNKIKQRTNT